MIATTGRNWSMDAFEQENQILFPHHLAFGQWLGAG